MIVAYVKLKLSSPGDGCSLERQNVISHLPRFPAAVKLSDFFEVEGKKEQSATFLRRTFFKLLKASPFDS